MGKRDRKLARFGLEQLGRLMNAAPHAGDEEALTAAQAIARRMTPAKREEANSDITEIMTRILGVASEMKAKVDAEIEAERDSETIH